MAPPSRRVQQAVRCPEHPPEEELVHRQREHAEGEAADAEREAEHAQGERTAVAILELVDHVEHVQVVGDSFLLSARVLRRGPGGRILGNDSP